MAKWPYPHILMEKLEVSHDQPVCHGTIKQKYSSGILVCHENVQCLQKSTAKSSVLLSVHFLKGIAKCLWGGEENRS